MLNELLRFLKTGIDPNLRKLVEIIKEYGISDIEARVISSAFMGWLEAYLNGATCPNCLNLITDDYRTILPEMKNGKILCQHCGRTVTPITVDPLRLHLCILNKVSIFETVPNSIKYSLPSNVVSGLRKNWDRVQRVLERVRPDDLYVPVLSWIKENRPDLYYTILFFNTGKNPEGLTISYMCTTIYEINFFCKLPKSHFLYKSMKKMAKNCMNFLIDLYRKKVEDNEEAARLVLFGKVSPTLKDVRDAIISLLDEIAKEDLEKLNKVKLGTEDSEKIISNLRISTEGIKWFASEIEEIYIKSVDVLSEII